MASKVQVKTTFEVAKAIRPIYTGGEVSSNATGSWLATTVDDDILIVETDSGKSLIRVDGDGESATSLCLSPTGSYLVVCSRSLSMRIYSLVLNGVSLSAELTKTLKPHTSPVISTTIDPTGSILVTGGADGIAKVWDLRGGYCSHTFHGHGGLVTAVELFQSSTATMAQQLSGSRKRKVKDISNFSLIEADSDTTIMLATGGEDGKVKIWDLSTRKNVATLDSHVSVVRSLKYSSQQDLLLSASRDRTLILWDIKTWTAKRVIPALETLEAGGFITNGFQCYSGGENGRLRIWNTTSGQEVTEKQSPGLETEAIVAVVKVLSEESLLTVHQDQTMVLHSYKGIEDLQEHKTIPPLPIIRRISGNHDEIIDMACIGPTGSQLALATNTESIKIISLGETDTGVSSFGSDVALLEGHQDVIICLDVDWSGHWLATGAKDNTARLWRLDPASSEFSCFAIFSGHAESLGAVALPKAAQTGSLNAKDPLNHPPPYLITGSQDKTIKKWDTSKLKIDDRQEEAYDVAKAVYTRVAHEKDINSLDISAIAPLFASASQDRTIKVWSVDDGSITGILRGHKRGVWSVAFSPAGTPPISLAEGGSSSNRGLLVSGSGDRTVKVWSLSSYTCLLTLEGHSNSVLKVIWLPPLGQQQEGDTPNQHRQNTNQPLIASAASDALVKLWSPYASLDTDHLLATLDNHTDRIWSLASRPAQTKSSSSASKKDNPQTSSFVLISGAADATLSFWRDTTTQTAAAQSKQQTERIEQDQLLQNHIHARNYRESITLALTLNHPGRLLKIFEDILNLPASEQDPNSLTGVLAVDQVLSTLNPQDLYRLLERIRDWNTNARTAPVAQRVLNVLLRSYPAETWTNMVKNQRRILSRVHGGGGGDQDENEDGTGDGAVSNPRGIGGVKRGKQMGMKDLFRALEVYTERHYKRLEELVDESYLLEYTLREMDEITGAAELSSSNGVTNGVNNYAADNLNGDGTKVVELDQDVIML